MSLDFLKELTPVFYNQHGIKAYEYDFASFLPHWHDRMEILLITKGVLNIQINKKSYAVKAGEVIILPPSTVHGSEPSPGVYYFVLMFDIRNFENKISNVKKFFSLLTEKSISLSYVISDKEIADLVMKIHLMQRSKNSTDSLIISAHIYTLLALILSRCVAETKPQFTAQNNFSQVISYIQEHFPEPLTSSQLCQKFGYSQGYFSRRFLSETGMTPTAFIRTVRLENAAQLLSETATPIRDIAVQCGFQDTKYFNRCFHELYGMTPSHYRQFSRSTEENMT